MLDKLRAWWNKDAEEAPMTPPEHDIAQEDYAGKNEDPSGGGDAREPHADSERDSEPPRY